MTVVALPRLQGQSALVDDQGNPTLAFHIWWDQFATNLETVLQDISSQVAAIAAAQSTADTAIANASAAAAQALSAANDAAAAAASALTAISNAATAQSTADSANTAASNAQSTANTVKRDDGIGGSNTVPGIILTASDAGTTAQIVIANHTRYYNDATSVSVTGGTLSSLSFSTTYYVYYDQTSRAGGSVTYHATIDAKTALPVSAAGRHYCGSVTTPADGGGSTTGGNNPPSGGGGIGGNQVN